MYYEINVALKGTHFFATDERSLTTTSEMKYVLSVFKKKFQKEEGYEITVKKVNTEIIYFDID